MKYLVDVNRSRSKKFLKNHPNFLNSKDEVGQNADDLEVLKYAKKNGFGIYTQDKRFALDALIDGVVVWYRNQGTGEKFKLKARRLKFTKKESGEED
jgi:predicted nuclease of predicted toxin-antitoxin system